MELERSRKMELLYTPRSELAKMMKENSISIDDILFLFSANKITPPEIRMNAPLLTDRLLGLLLKQWGGTANVLPTIASPNQSKPTDETSKELHSHAIVESRVSKLATGPQQVVA